MNRTTKLGAAVLCAAMVMSAHAGGNESFVLQLDRAASYEQGCFGLCDCAVYFSGAVTGTMTLTPQVLGGTVDIYEVSDVQWQLDVVGLPARIYTGSGTYTRFKEFAPLQQLELDLVAEGEEPEHFDSGVVPIEAKFPQIDATISIHGMVCFDTVFEVVASPATPVFGDLNGDGKVNGLDLALLLGEWGNCPLNGVCPCPADLNCDSWINGLDLALLLGAWTG